MKEKTTLWNNGLIWFGAGISIAEILTGTYLAPLGFARGLLAILAGHLIGGLIFFLVGYMGARSGRSAMETVKMSFGKKGGLLFSLLNIVQLIGWTAIMIYDGALAATGIFSVPAWIWMVVIGLLIAGWILVGITNLGPLNLVSMTALFVLTLVLCVSIFHGKGPQMGLLDDSMSFGMALELSVAMPLSWLPLVSDYTRFARKPLAASIVSAVVYNGVSSWMYIMGLGAALLLADYSAAGIMGRIGLGVLGLLVIVLATVTTTFMDAYSAGVSAVSIWKKLGEKWMALIVTAIGLVCALIFPMDDFTDFLYLIGSVFAPMAAILIADHYILRRDFFDRQFQVENLLVWFAGFIGYRYLLTVDTPLGSTLPDVGITLCLCVLVGLMAKIFRKKRSA